MLRRGSSAWTWRRTPIDTASHWTVDGQHLVFSRWQGVGWGCPADEARIGVHPRRKPRGAFISPPGVMDLTGLGHAAAFLVATM